ncbi:uncharacterized protein LTR77_009767 [Saxophila tyrrhenica]|uniref:Uncharacterized protein n=1 Tax=Saxophila tyrrhenica TaxID=1690608 RepID=A0AAV9NXG5_9PEZI|nr:hypothetical protein LTR77_009767 [Saxophila tyrrhenica]
MSDPAAEPGVPNDGATNVPAAGEKSIAAEVKQRVPGRVVSLASTPDRIILRINKLLANPGGLSAFLSTLNYTLYLLAFASAKTAPLQARLSALLSKATGRPATAILAGGVAPEARILALAGLFSSARVTMRLFGLFPMYAWMRQLLQGPKPGQDQILYATSFTQCSLYMMFQFLENVALLTDHAVLPTSYTEKYLVKSPAPGAKPTSKIYLWAYRAWFAGVLCDVVKLAREAQLESSKRSERGEKGVTTRSADEAVDKKWWSDAVVPAAWTPVAAQFSVEGGFGWFNLGIMGACGMLAGLSRTASLWAETA